jgi:hypothetical protein
MRWRHVILATATSLLGGPAQGHHSFAVFFEAEGSVSATGVVTEFNFRNPHASITIEAEGADGEVVVWKGETNAPTLLRRRGWTAESLAIGETITIEGWPARDGSHYMRIRLVKRQDGSIVGQPLGFSDD